MQTWSNLMMSDFMSSSSQSGHGPSWIEFHDHKRCSPGPCVFCSPAAVDTYPHDLVPHFP